MDHLASEDINGSLLPSETLECTIRNKTCNRSNCQPIIHSHNAPCNNTVVTLEVTRVYKQQRGYRKSEHFSQETRPTTQLSIKQAANPTNYHSSEQPIHQSAAHAAFQSNTQLLAPTNQTHRKTHHHASAATPSNPARSLSLRAPTF